MAGRFPGCSSLEEFWEALAQGKTFFRPLPAERHSKLRVFWYEGHVPAMGQNFHGSFIDDFDLFDPLFFKLSPIDAISMDPQQRQFLEVTWQAIEDAGYSPRSLAGSLTGVFVGAAVSGYAHILRFSEEPEVGKDFTGTIFGGHANRVSYTLDLQGPSEVIDTACSSSLVAVHRAVQSIRSGECEAAIAGGVNLILDVASFIMLGQAGMLAPDGRCKSFDAAADGYSRGEGVGAVYLKPLQAALDAGDNIRAVVRGSAIRHSGHSTSTTAPNVESQEKLINSALRDARVRPEHVGYIETHGTGTRLGDPIEINALRKVFDRVDSPHGIGIGTVKSNIGHLETAAGIAGLIKTVLCLEHQQLPPLATLKKANELVRLEHSPMYLLSALRSWEAPTDQAGKPIPRIACVSSFGVGGVIVHSVVEEGVQRAISSDSEHCDAPLVFCLSARTKAQLECYAGRLHAHLARDRSSLYDTAMTLLVGRHADQHRIAVVADSRDVVLEALAAFAAGGTDGNWIYADTRDHRETVAILGDDSKLAIESTIQRGDLRKLAAMWTRGFHIPWTEVFRERRFNRISLPSYPFDRASYWPKQSPPPVAQPDPSPVVTEPTAARDVRPKRVLLDEVRENLTTIFADVLRLSRDKLDPDASFADWGVDSLSGLRIMQRIQKEYSDALPIAAVLENASLNRLAAFIIKEVVDAIPATPRAEASPADVSPDTVRAAPVRVEAINLCEGDTACPVVVLCADTGELSWAMHWIDELGNGARVVGLEPDRGGSVEPDVWANAIRKIVGDGKRVRIAAFGAMSTVAVALATDLETHGVVVERVDLVAPDLSPDKTDVAMYLASLYHACWRDSTQADGPRLAPPSAQSNAGVSHVARWLLSCTNVPIPADQLEQWLLRASDHVRNAASPVHGTGSVRAPLHLHTTCDGSHVAWSRMATDVQLHRYAVTSELELLTASRKSLPETAPAVSFVTFNAKGSEKPVFCFPTLYGDVGYATTLSMHMGRKFPLYGFELWDGVDPVPFPDMKSMASACVEQLLRAAPGRPYRLLGLSYGGIVAYEACYQLQQAGHTVSDLILLDPYMPNTPAVDAFNDIALQGEGIDMNQLGLANVIYARWQVREPLDPSKLMGLSEEEQIARLARHLAEHSARNLSLASAQHIIRSYFALDRANRRANAGYYPRPLIEPVSTLMICAMQGFYNPANHARQKHQIDRASAAIVAPVTDTTKGFGEYTRGEMTVIPIDTDHLSMPAHIPACARHVMEFLEEKGARGDRRSTETQLRERRITYEI